MFPEFMQFHVSGCIDAFVQWLNLTFGDEFAVLTTFILKLIALISWALKLIPWWVWLTAILLVSWRQTRRLITGVLLAALMMTVGLFGLWETAMDTLAIVCVSVILAVIVGIPLGILMSQSTRIEAAVTPLLDGMQTMPSFVYLIPALMLFGLGKVPAVLATVIYALPPAARLTNLGIRQVSVQVIEAAQAFGATRWQTMKEVLLPLAMPSLLAGINQTTMMALSMVVIASMIGAGGLGEKVLLSINRIEVGSGFEAGFAVVCLAIVVDRLTQGLTRRWQIPTTKV